MKRYRQSYLISGLLISIPCAFLVLVGIETMRLPHIMVWGGLLCLWWLAYYCLHKSTPGSFAFSFVLTNLCWWPLLIQTVRRVVFVVQNGGMDRADGYGSPLAFLMGAVFEQFFFLPLSLVIVFGVAALLRKRQGALSVDHQTDY
jgi:hypothetical protein